MNEKHALYPSLEGRTVFITGGGTGIGASLTRAFARQNAQVVFVDIAAEESRALVDSVVAEKLRRPDYMSCDIRDISALQDTIAKTHERYGNISVLVNNAANDDRHHIEDVTVPYWDDRMAINLRPMFFAAQSVVPQMEILGGGSIINFGSVSWRMGTADVPAYATAKAAVHGLTRSLARDLGKRNIRVNTLVPGWVMTERQLRLWVTPESEKVIDSNQFLKSRVYPEHIANMALFLAADDSALCNAQEFIVDGGWV